ncbi:MAG: choice-of-anchor E domain-containing protein [Akkermansiaceae bacterium]|nr:choice-of-anchor E domain-containing protein [Akkermansiaceae bacterium]MDP4646606.1 choice-of-anchor E domain-containing protein [Akkermansiaceae bacterium]MDP4720195.1 choice-of-anchor E domain-containing protein [Akkermansiaceae bacterium]MDP4779815.1 choice-of-anchor E domain-containing protein [Akkermansiaceae bacterium]MDP4896698.1 choice-of-anchor E domain-containing protein [Akkermansiaceae bacterium]
MKTSAALLVLLLCPLAAYSQTLTTSSEYGLPIVKTKTEINQTGTLAKFDSNLGELTGATLIIYGAADFSVQATNNSPQSQTARIGSTTSLFITSSETALNNLIQSETKASISPTEPR